MGAIEDIADDYSKSQMVALGIVFIIVPIIAVGLRIWAKLLGNRGIAGDDYLVFGSLAFAIGCCSVQLIAATRGQLGQHQTVDAEGLPILDDPKFVLYEKCKFAVNILSTLGLSLTKASILIFYKNIFFGKAFRMAVYVVLGIVTSWGIAFFFANLFTCYPISPFIEAFYHGNCINGLQMWYAMAISDIIIDFIILFMPIPMVLGLQLPIKQKLGVLMMFLLGLTVCAFSITRELIYAHVGEKLAIHFNDETYYTSPVFFWAVIELSSAIFCVSLPTYRPIWLFVRGQPVRETSNKNSIRLSSYAQGKSGSSRSTGKRSNVRQVDSELNFDDDDFHLTRDATTAAQPGVHTTIETGSRRHEDVDGQIVVERAFLQDSR